ncbi:MAG: hypothetical protein ACTSYC_02215 [Promethearchaeota archaeon]
MLLEDCLVNTGRTGRIYINMNISSFYKFYKVINKKETDNIDYN